MYASPAPRSRSVWADLDALVLEEVNALRTEPDNQDEAPAFASEEDFLTRAGAYLRGHDNRQALLARLSGQLEPVEVHEDANPGDSSAEPEGDSAGAAADQPDPAPQPDPVPPSLSGGQEPAQ